MKTSHAVLLTLALAIPATWIASRLAPEFTGAPRPSAGTNSPRKLLYYQSAMHPWIKSDKPGRCTICGMNLTPVYEGDTGFDAASDVVPLSPSMIQVLQVQTAEIARLPLRKTLTVAGIIEDNSMRHRVLSAYIPGRIEKLHINYVGAEVGEGQPLADFYSPTLLQAEREYRTLTGELREATALRLRQMGLTSSQISALAEKPAGVLTSPILAPIGGTVVLQSVYEGQYVQEGEKLFEIADFSTMWFQFRVYEQDLPWIQPGLVVDVTTPSSPGRTFSGRITFIDPNFQESTRSTRVRVELENPPIDGRRRLLHRVYADGNVHLRAPEVVAAPRTAILEAGPEAVAYVDLGSGNYSRRTVTLGRRGDTLVEVTSGLTPGERVVVNGNLLIDGHAEIHRAFASPAAPANPTKASTPSLPAPTEMELEAARVFLALADAITRALASDDLADFNAQAAKTHTATPSFLKAFPESSPWQAILKPFEKDGHLGKADDLRSARRAFHPFSTAVVALAQALRRSTPDFAGVRVFRCPMTKDAFPGAPNRAEWMQLLPAVRNPYFGAEMLDCGSEVKP